MTTTTPLSASSSTYPNRCAHPVDRAPCEEVINFAPDPDNLNHTPIKYVKFVLHIIQNRDVNDYHPDDLVFFPGNFTNSDAHMQVLRDWFHHPEHGMNADLSDICAQNNLVPGFETPHISDSRIRFLFQGIENQDVFFYDNKGLWEAGLFDGNGYGNPRASEKRNMCVNNNSLVQSNDEILNSIHVIISGPNKIQALGDYDYRYNNWGFVLGTGPLSGGGIGSKRDVIYGGGYFYYYMWNKFGLEPSDSDLWSTIYDGETSEFRALKSFLQIRNEWLHIVHVDHPDQIAHMSDQMGSSDYCDDVPPGLSNNKMDSRAGIANCGSLTQCQIGRIHQTIDKCNPSWIRTTANSFSYPPLFEYCEVSEPDIVISSGQEVSWMRQLQVRSNIIIESGATLNITCEVGFPEDARIVVKKGGRLNLNKARLYSNCGSEFWGGVVVEGDGVTAQHAPATGTPSQGFLSMKNESVIEQAKVGVRCMTDAGIGGGIVQAENSVFLNCQKRAVDIRNFRNTDGSGNHVNNISRFDGCSFITTPTYPNSASFEQNFTEMVRFQEVEGITLFECDLVNSPPQSVTVLEDRGNGITAIDAGFFLRGACVSEQLPCTEYATNTVQGFDRGIYAVNTAGIRTFTTTYTEFDDNFTAIEAIAVPSPYIRFNDIKVGSSDPADASSVADNNIGVRLINCTGYELDGNAFEASSLSATEDPIGALLQSSGELPNEINKNSFRNLEIGFLSNGQNRSLNFNPDFQTGLQVLCNDFFIGQQYDMAIPDQPGTINPGIRANQGDPTRPAENRFTYVTSTSDPELHIHNRQNVINYYSSSFYAPTRFNSSFVNGGVVSLNVNCRDNGGVMQNPHTGVLTGSEILGHLGDAQSSDINVAIPAQDALTRHYLINDDALEVNTVVNWLSTRADLYSRFREVDACIQTGTLPEAITKMNELQSSPVLANSRYVQEYNSFKALKVIQIGARQSSEPYDVAMGQQESSIAAIAAQDGLYAARQAKALLTTGMSASDIRVPYTLPSLSMSRRGQNAEPGQQHLGITYEGDQDRVSYQIPEEINMTSLELFDTQGTLVWQQDLVESVGQLTIPQELTRPGIYILLLRNIEDNSIMQSVKYMKLR